MRGAGSGGRRESGFCSFKGRCAALPKGGGSPSFLPSLHPSLLPSLPSSLLLALPPPSLPPSLPPRLPPPSVVPGRRLHRSPGCPRRPAAALPPPPPPSSPSPIPLPQLKVGGCPRVSGWPPRPEGLHASEGLRGGRGWRGMLRGRVVPRAAHHDGSWPAVSGQRRALSWPARALLPPGSVPHCGESRPVGFLSSFHRCSASSEPPLSPR